MKKLTTVLMIVMMATVGLTACDLQPQTPISVIKNVPIEPILTENQVVLDKSNTFTVGNNSYLAINMLEEASDYAPLILEIVNTFEKTHPELVIINWVLENRNEGYSRFPKIYGIWIHHRPKTTAELEAPPQ